MRRKIIFNAKNGNSYKNLPIYSQLTLLSFTIGIVVSKMKE